MGQTFLSARIDSVLSVPLYVRSVRANVFTLFHRQDNRTDGRFFAALRMTCYAIGIVEVYSSCVGPDFHAEKAGARVGQTFLSARIASVLSKRRRNMTTRIGLALLVASSFWACGGDSVTTPEQPVLERGLKEVGNMVQPRYWHTATLLPNGKVLIAGGLGEPPAEVRDPSQGGAVIYRASGLLASAEIFDPQTGTSTPTGDMTVRRYADSGILLPDGRVLIMPRDGHFPVEIYDPASGTFAAVSDVPAGATVETATLLPSGEVFLTNLDHTGVFDPDARAFHSIFKREEIRRLHTATLLKDGRVLIVGGSRGGLEDGLVGRNVIYDPSSRRVSEAGNLQVDRINHKAVLLQDGRVLIVGGTAGKGPFVQTAEMYDPETNTFSPAGVSNIDPLAAALLPSGTVLLVHSHNGDIVMYNPATHAFSPTGHNIGWRSLPTVTMLEDGRAMVAGGWESEGYSTHGLPSNIGVITDKILIFTP